MAAPAPALMQLKVRIPENEEVARCLHEKRLSMREQPAGFKEHLDRTFAKAYRNVCAANEPIRTLKEFSKISGVGPWLIRCMKGFFAESKHDSPAKGKKTRVPKCCVTKKKTAASASLGKGPPSNLNCQNAQFSSSQGTLELQPSGKTGSTDFNMLDKDVVSMNNCILAMPPRQSSEEFLEAYEVVLILDDRENFGYCSRKVASKKVADNIGSQFNVPVEVKRLPVGDGIWIARHKKNLTEYVLDFIVERKNVADLGSSIRDNRYKDQKTRLQRCGLRKLMYLVEGDPNTSKGSAASIKTACFTTEIFEGFDVLRTNGYTDTMRTYGYLTLSIMDYYSTNFCRLDKSACICPTYDEFERHCHCLQKRTVSQIFALQLMQVPQVTEKVALTVIEFYPTLFSLARAYSMLEGDIHAQEEMLKNKSKMINAGASRNIFRLVWGDGCQSSGLILD
uniref:Crossover junction endonuclease MUS81 n=1 Tax=Zea mays subsp. mays TaxID=381124 RepID=A0A1P8W0G9_MAIZE|nr:structure-specific endonuclease subunit MUS81-1 [Zea mays subsp. mays]APZ84461.1 structure-specific endonuclease subunit MUS81-1 [Zea mays subsp. mays]APZ84470.1 structure-specific endonuclease subunit MUS81-1 [Zea mays subsp. mays]APZ84471.1 structure-specific endonuclease subunit MUS81-1 [Zea mays subsp. mays]APZ84473.1 structure-specific endonuclease subunit MUS81-1 [Zea mays subsp. mays]